MTTLVYANGTMAADGQVTRYDSLIESTTFVKVRKIGGHLVGGCGSGISILKFFDWLEDTLEVEYIQKEFPFVDVLPPKDMVEEDFQAIVVTPEGSIFEYVGTKNVFPVSDPYISVGSGCFFAYPLLDAGYTARQAVEGAIKRDPYSSGLITEVSLEAPVPPLTKELAEQMTKEELFSTLFPSEEKESEKELDKEETEE